MAQAPQRRSLLLLVNLREWFWEHFGPKPESNVNPERQRRVLATVRFYIWSPDRNTDRAVSGAFNRLKGEGMTNPEWRRLGRTLQRLAQAAVPAEVSVENISLEVEDSAFLTAVIVVYGVVTGYGAIRQGLEYLVRDTQSFLDRLARDNLGYPSARDVEVRGVWIPGADFHVLTIESTADRPRGIGAFGFFLAYLAITNLLLLAGLVAFLWKAVARL